jgi:hypothetical protein
MALQVDILRTQSIGQSEGRDEAAPWCQGAYLTPDNYQIIIGAKTLEIAKNTGGLSLHLNKAPVQFYLFLYFELFENTGYDNSCRTQFICKSLM